MKKLFLLAVLTATMFTACTSKQAKSVEISEETIEVVDSITVDTIEVLVDSVEVSE